MFMRLLQCKSCLTQIVCGLLLGIGPCIPVADIRDTDMQEYDKGEKVFRCKLASLYRLVDLFAWTRGIQSYITVSSD